jgi:transposase-like protein
LRSRDGGHTPEAYIRASRPDQIWHVDTTLIQLLEGRRVYLYAIIDNFSRRILAWQVSATFDPGVTAMLLHRAVSGLSGDKPTLLADELPGGSAGIGRVALAESVLRECVADKRVL